MTHTEIDHAASDLFKLFAMMQLKKHNYARIYSIGITNGEKATKIVVLSIFIKGT